MAGVPQAVAAANCAGGLRTVGSIGLYRRLVDALGQGNEGEEPAGCLWLGLR